MRPTQKQIAQLKKRSAAINYRSLSVDMSGKLLKDKKSFNEYLDERVVPGYGLTWAATNDYNERFVKGAFSKSISEFGPNSGNVYQIKFRDRHGKSVSLFSELTEDEIGLKFLSKPLDKVQWADDLITQLRSGTINNFSIGFNYIWDKIEYDEQNDALIILEAKLYEISAVDIPSDTSTFAIRSLEEIEYVDDDVEDFISSLPRSKRLDARRLFSRYKSLIIDKPQEVNHRTALNKRNKPIKQIDTNKILKNLNF